MWNQIPDHEADRPETRIERIDVQIDEIGLRLNQEPV